MLLDGSNILPESEMNIRKPDREQQSINLIQEGKKSQTRQKYNGEKRETRAEEDN